MLVAVLTGVGNAKFQTLFGSYGIENMAADVPRLGTLSDARHVAAYAVTKTVNRMGAFSISLLVTGEAQFVIWGFSLSGEKGIAQLMYRMTGDTAYITVSMFGPFPIQVLLVVSLGVFVGVEVFVSSGDGFVVEAQRFTREIAHWPTRTFNLGRLTTIVAGAANLHGNTASKFAGMNDC